MSRSLYENHWGCLTLISLNVLGVLGVLYALYVLYVLHVLHMLNMLMDASLACWALFFMFSSSALLRNTATNTIIHHVDARDA